MLLGGLLFSSVGRAQPPVEDAPNGDPPRPGVGHLPADVLQVAVGARNRPLPQRIDAISAALRGRPYLADPLGEGQAIDADPFARYDVFDCLTYVEEVLALALSADPAHAASVRDGLRYGGAERTYARRHHFMELQWIPAAISGGWLVDTTREYGETILLEREVTDATWRDWNKRPQFAHADDELPKGVMRLHVLPLETARAVADRLRPGTVVLTVREDRPWVPLWVTHVGLVVQGPDHLLHRHATRIGQGGTRDHALSWYLEHVGTYGPWRTLGIVLLEPVEHGPRLARLSEAPPSPAQADPAR